MIADGSTPRYIWIDDASTVSQSDYDYIWGTATGSTERKDKPMFEQGTKVKIVSASHGWGDCGVCEGDIATVNRSELVSDGRRYYLEVHGKAKDWVCYEYDLTDCEGRVLRSNHVTQFVNRMSDTFSSDLERLTRSYEEESKKIVSLRNRITNIRIPDTDLVNAVKQRIDDLRFVDSKMYFTTKRITLPFQLPGFPLVNVDMGYYSVCVDFITGSVSATQQVPEKYLIHYDHPHISNHECCWGSYYDTKKELIKALDIVGIINLMLDFLSSCDRYGWYHPVFNWMTPSDKRPYENELCYRCWHHHDDCECEYCSQCDNPMDECSCRYCDYCDSYGDDCSCLRCPDNSDRLEDNCFPDSQCLQCEHCLKNLDSMMWECTYYGGTPHWESDIDCYDERPIRSSYQYRIQENNQVRQIERTTAQ